MDNRKKVTQHVKKKNFYVSFAVFLFFFFTHLYNGAESLKRYRFYDFSWTMRKALMYIMREKSRNIFFILSSRRAISFRVFTINHIALFVFKQYPDIDVYRY